MNQIQSLHSLFCALTGATLLLDMERERWWFEWQRRGFKEDDLRLVIAHIQAGIKRGQRKLGALKFHNLIEMADRFEEEKWEAQAEKNLLKKAARPVRALPQRPDGRLLPLASEDAPPTDYSPLQPTADRLRELIENLKKAVV